MVRVDEIHSLSDFQRNARAHIERLKQTGRPEVLTVNGAAEVVVQDARSYQKLVELADETVQRERLLRSAAEYRAGKARPLADALTDLESRMAKKLKPRVPRRSK